MRLRVFRHRRPESRAQSPEPLAPVPPKPVEHARHTEKGPHIACSPSQEETPVEGTMRATKRNTARHRYHGFFAAAREKRVVRLVCTFRLLKLNFPSRSYLSIAPSGS